MKLLGPNGTVNPFKSRELEATLRRGLLTKSFTGICKIESIENQSIAKISAVYEVLTRFRT